jgi:hypothetical protein
MFKKTYKLETPDEPAMSLDVYGSLVNRALRELLDSQVTDEYLFQALLEDHPSLVPGLYPNGSGHNGIFPGAVISQPRLAGMPSKVPDFGIISHDSGTLYATFVEIESPSKRWANKDGTQSSDLTQAIGQLRDWQIWFESPKNRLGFLEDYQVPSHLSSRRAFVQRYYLVYGRRDDLQRSKFELRRASAQKPNEEFMTWDRLRPSSHHWQVITAKLDAGGYRAHRVPPCVVLGPTYADWYALIREKELAVECSPHLSPVRKRFLQERWRYWDSWATCEDSTRGVIQARDHE